MKPYTIDDPTIQPMRFHSQRATVGLMDLIQFFPQGCAGVEIGSFAGESAEIFMRSGRVAHLTCVDSWLEDYFCNKETVRAQPAFYRRLSPWIEEQKIRVMKVSSTEALQLLAVENARPDFVYIDGNHKYEFVASDIRLSMLLNPLIIAGHDYGRREVERGVREYLQYPDLVFADSSWLKFMNRVQNCDALRLS